MAKKYFTRVFIIFAKIYGTYRGSGFASHARRELFVCTRKLRIKL